MNQGINTLSKSLPTISTSIWVNVNLRVSYANYILLNAWQGNNWYDINPSLKIAITDGAVPSYTNNTLVIEKTSSTFGVSIAEIRVFTLLPS